MDLEGDSSPRQRESIYSDTHYTPLCEQLFAAWDLFEASSFSLARSKFRAKHCKRACEQGRTRDVRASTRRPRIVSVATSVVSWIELDENERATPPREKQAYLISPSFVDSLFFLIQKKECAEHSSSFIRMIAADLNDPETLARRSICAYCAYYLVNFIPLACDSASWRNAGILS